MRHVHRVICDKQLRPFLQAVITNVHNQLVKCQISIYCWYSQLKVFLIVEQQFKAATASPSGESFSAGGAVDGWLT